MNKLVMKNIIHQISALLFALVLCSSSLKAAGLRASISPSEGDVGTTFQLTLQVQGELDEEIEFPKLPGISLLGTSQSSQVSYINGRRTSSISFIYSLKVDSPGAYAIPPITAKINGSVERSNATRFMVAKPSDHIKIEGSKLPGAFIQRNYSSRKPYVGEAVVRTTKLFFRIKVTEESRSVEKPEHTRMFTDVEKEVGQEEFSQQRYSVLSYYDVLVANRPGKLTIPSDYVSIGIQMQSARRSRNSFFGDLFDDAFSRRTTKTLSAKEDLLEVQPLPSEGKPGKYSGIVGAFKLGTKLSTRELKQGETATLTVEISGRGLLDTMGSLPIDFTSAIKVYPDKPVNEEKISKTEGISSKRIYKFALVPNQAGNLDLGTLQIPIFNPDKESYEILNANLGSLEVTAAPEEKKVIAAQSLLQRGTGKTEVESLANDLVDIHRSFNLESQTGFNSKNRVWYFILAGLAPILFCLSMSLQAFVFKGGRSSSKQRRTSALKYFNQDKQKWEATYQKKDLSTEAIEAYYRIYKDFLGNKFDTNGSALTSKEIEHICDSLALSDTHKSYAKEIVKSMDQLAFSDGLFNANQGSKLLNKIDDLISEIDRNVS